MKRVQAVLTLLLTVPLAVKASTVVVDVTGTNYGCVQIFSRQFPEVSWTTSQFHTNVSITVPLRGIAGQTVTGTAYLTTAVGPGTGSAAVVAKTTFYLT